jgi:hypothetical protein
VTTTLVPETGVSEGSMDTTATSLQVGGLWSMRIRDLGRDPPTVGRAFIALGNLAFRR